MSTPHFFDARRLIECFDPGTNDRVIAEALGIDRGAVNKWRNGRSYRLGAYRADRYALRIGRHPIEVWGDEWWLSALPVG